MHASSATKPLQGKNAAHLGQDGLIWRDGCEAGGGRCRGRGRGAGGHGNVWELEAVQRVQRQREHAPASERLPCMVGTCVSAKGI